MDIKTIKNVIALFEASNLSEIEVSEESSGSKLNIKLAKPSAIPLQQISYTPKEMQHLKTEQKEATTVKLELPTQDVVDFNRSVEIKSPMVGVFYAASSPEDEPFVSKGTKVKKGDTLCIIEAMKLMNEVVAERDGEIIEVCVSNGKLVEFGQTLFKIC